MNWNLLFFIILGLLIIYFIFYHQRQSQLDQAFYDWRHVYPELRELKNNYQTITSELANIKDWIDWPETNLYDQRPNQEWKVFAFLADGKWNRANLARCPKTAKMLKALPNLKTASFSRLGPNTELDRHRGWADISNGVLRCHLGLQVPKGCQIWCDGQWQNHREGDWLVFDDSKNHSAVNPDPTQNRIILLLDLKRPDYVKQGQSTVARTSQLQQFLAQNGFN